mmetsp:Transcript_25703/g.77178  ORF Transcript_25703/g.77178 Transcript_25703/m.77178 type:complete len:410 (+) Transcript_25703:541-1770(+)
MLSDSFGRVPAASDANDYCSNLPCVIRTRDAHVAELVTRCRPPYEYQVVDTVRHVVKPPPALKHMSNRTPSPKTIVVYSGPTTLKQQLYMDNFEYFLKHGLPSSRHGCSLNVTVIVVLTKATLAHYATQISQYNASCGEIRTKVREDRCYDMESARVALASGLLFDKLVFLNCGLKGPFQSAPSFWAAEFTTRLNADVKFTGMTINCVGKLGVHHAHVQSMIWATDRVGLASIQKAGAIYDCKDQLSKANGRDHLILKYELGMSRAVMKDGYAIQDLTNRTFHWAEAQKQRCGDLWNNARLWEKYPPSTLHFWKMSRGAQKHALSQWAASSGSGGHGPHKKPDRDAMCYAGRYPDLRAAFCKGGACDVAKLRRHWDQHRAHEIRVFGCGTPRPECCTRGAAECSACMQK